MQALGLIETRGLLAAIESTDTMLKAADVSILEKTYVGGGLVSISVTGDVGAVKAAVEAGVAAVKKLDSKLLISYHVIPRPHDELSNIIITQSPLKEVEISLKNDCSDISNDIFESKSESDKNNISENEILKEEEKKENSNYIVNDSEKIELNEKDLINEEIIEERKNELKVDLNNLQKVTVDNLVKEFGIEKTIKILAKLKVAKLRELARQYKDFKVTEGKISKASKKLLITKFKAYYE